MVKLRTLKEEDISEVNQLLTAAFSQGRKEDGYAETRVPLCNPHMLAMYLSASPEGCFAFEEGGEIAAVSFSHIWGNTGWLGPIAVKPQYRGKKFGREITEHSIQYLKNMKCRTIGLETMPRSYHNLGFYIKLGFHPGPLTYEASKFTPAAAAQPDIASADERGLRCMQYRESRKRSFLVKARAVADRASPGTDYSQFITSTERYSFGESMLFEAESGPVALAVAHTAAYSLIEKKKLYRVCLLIVVGENAEDHFKRIVALLEQRTHQSACAQIFFRLPARHRRESRYLLEHRYKIVHSDLRMTLDGYPEVNAPETIHFNRWE